MNVSTSPFKGLGNALRKQVDGMFLVDVREQNKTYGPFDEAQVFKVMWELGVEEVELDMTLDELIVKDHNYADFGINGTLIFTAKKVF